VRLNDIVDTAMARPGPVRLVAIDGPGGSGKSTFAAAFARAAGGAPVAHTDDFASADNPITWWPRLLEQVIEPLVGGRAARYQRYDWPTEQLAEWVDIAPAPIVIIEGVSAGRREWREHLAFIIWIDTPSDVRLQRGLARDGDDWTDDWDDSMAAEDAHYAHDPTREVADIVIDVCAPIDV
jgi:uridine kinase